MAEIEEMLNLDALRAPFVAHTRQAYRLLPALERPRILDLGCGRGLQTLELARLSDGEIVAIDPDAAELAHLEARIEKDDLSQRITAKRLSLYDNGFPDGLFDVIWEEGVMRLLDASKSLPECSRLLERAGFLVMHEEVTWFESVQNSLPTHGLQPVAQHRLPRHVWWTDYYAPLEAAIRKLRATRGSDLDPVALARYEREVVMVKADPGRFDCAFFILQKRGG